MQSGVLATVNELYENRVQSVLELRKQGTKIIGYFCCQVPVEILSAAGFLPYRIMGNIEESPYDADVYLETDMCPYVRNCFAMMLKGAGNFLDGIVVPHTCDAIQRIYGFLRDYCRPGYIHYVDIPHTIQYPCLKFYKGELAEFKKSVEALAGREISEDRLRQSIQFHNRQRALMRQLYELRKQNPPLLSGSEVLKIIVATMSIPVEEANSLLERVVREVTNRQDGVERQPVRLLVYGSVIDDVRFIELFEGCGANVVMDDLPIGTRSYGFEVEAGVDPLDSLSQAYLINIRCPRMVWDEKGPRQAELENRFGYILKYVRDFKVDGVVLNILKFCDVHEFDMPELRDYLKQNEVPVLCIEGDYSIGEIERLKTRVEAFIEVLLYPKAG